MGWLDPNNMFGTTKSHFGTTKSTSGSTKMTFGSRTKSTSYGLNNDDVISVPYQNGLNKDDVILLPQPKWQKVQPLISGESVMFKGGGAMDP
jgi:hypothetical protein